MDKVFLVFLILFLTLLLLSLTTVQVQINYAWRGREDRFTLEFSAWGGLLKYLFVLPGITVKREKRRSAIKSKTKKKSKAKKYTGLLQKARLRRFTWHSEIGAGDPFYTGMLTGAVWGLKGVLITLFYRQLPPGGTVPVVVVRPSYHQVCFNTAIDCTLEIRLGYLVTVLPALIAGRRKTRQI